VCEINIGLISSFPKYGNPFTTYLLFTSDANQNFMPNLSGLFGMYWVNLHLAFIGKSYSSTVIFAECMEEISVKPCQNLERSDLKNDDERMFVVNYC